DEIAAGNIETFLVFQESKRLLYHFEGQAQLPAEIKTEQTAVRVESPQNHVVEKSDRQARLLEVFRGRRRFSQGGPFPFQRVLFCGAYHVVVFTSDRVSSQFALKDNEGNLPSQQNIQANTHTNDGELDHARSAIHRPLDGAEDRLKIPGHDACRRSLDDAG